MTDTGEAVNSRKIGRFEILREIGQGGMGVVYLALQPSLQRRVVLKRIRRELTFDDQMIERFQREARAAAAVQHQNVVAVHDCFSFRGHEYIALEYVEGVDLLNVLAAGGRLPPRVAGWIALEMARGLEAIHERGIVHRDLKPANVLLGNRGGIKIADFGVALEGRGEGLTHPGVMLGSLPYMAPEQMRGHKVDERCDLFAFGVCCYEMLTGASPFSGHDCASADTIIRKIEKRQYLPPRERADGIPRLFDRVVRSCLEPKPARRPPSASEICRRLERKLRNPSAAAGRRMLMELLQARGLVEAPDPGRRRSRAVAAPAPERWRLAAATVVAFIAMVVLGVGWTALRHREDPAEARVRSESRAPAATVEPPAWTAVRAAGESFALHPVAGTAGRLAAGAPATLRLVAQAGTHVSIDGGTPFLLEGTAAVEVTAGQHTVRFDHPVYGLSSRVVRAVAGETRVLRHVPEAAVLP